MELNASGTLLAQHSATTALAELAFQANAQLNVEVTKIVICNTTAGAIAASLFHDDTGSNNFVAGTALLFAKNIPANDYLILDTNGPNNGFHLAKGAQIGITDPSSGGLTFSIYGITQVVDGSGARK